MNIQDPKTQGTAYPNVQSDVDFVALEKEVLAFWNEQRVFDSSVTMRPEQTANGDSNAYVFYDGPPFANGLPHHGHLLTGYVKDMVARYQTMKGHRVERRFGWDCHGLPAEMEAEKQLGVSGRQQIMEHGIEKFNNHCRTSVMRYRDDWEDYVNRQARWVDFENDYKTMDTPYMESVLWAFSELHKKGLIYEGFKVMPYSWAAETVLSTSEIRLDDATREKVDKAVTVAFKLKNHNIVGIPQEDDVYVVAWTTTPWTLPSNLALAASSEITYVAKYSSEKKKWLIRQDDSPLAGESKSASDSVGGKDGAKDTPHQNSIAVLTPPQEGSYSVEGKDLIGLSYEPLFPYFADHPNAFRILDGSDFIEEGSGTGIVHIAPGFGEDDQRVCADNGIDVVVPVDGEGRYTDAIFDIDNSPLAGESKSASDSVGGKDDAKDAPHQNSNTVLTPPQGGSLSLRGLNVISETQGKCDAEPYTDAQLAKYGLANLRIINWLKLTGHLIKQDDYAHNYPHCWRTDKPIIYKAMSSWFVDVPKIRDRMVELNQEINWIPNHIKDGRFGKWLDGAREWSISRSRFWGCPIPVWRSNNPDNDQLYVFGSIAELEAFFDTKVDDLHKPYIDELTKPDPSNPDYTISRVDEVFDCWFESGSMPYAQVHYPFENKEWFEANYPADFIVEYEAQTRGWFYNMMVLSVALFDNIPFKNCICHGVVLDDKGQKLSKKLKNFADPMELFNTYGSDALRWFMLSSTIMRGNELFLDPEGAFIRDAVRLYIKPLWNAYHFFCLYANADEVRAEYRVTSENVMDRYILAKLATCVEDVRAALDAYDTPTACTAISGFLEVLNNWYIRRCRPRFWQEEKNDDKLAAYHTLYTVLHTVCRVAAPFLPQVSEAIYLGLVQGIDSPLETSPSGRGRNSEAVSGEGNISHTSPHPNPLPEGEGITSVHLTRYPEELRTLSLDASLMHDMDRVQEICNTAHGLRNDVNIRIRQPLASLHVYGANIHNHHDYFKALIADETNVKDVVFSDDLEAVATRQLKINFKVAGKRLGAKMKAVGAAARSGEWALQEDGTITLAGETLQPEEFDYTLESTLDKDSSALPAQDGLVVIDTTLTDALRQEGIARDIVRLVQQSRKDADFNVADRIHLSLQGSSAVEAAAKAYENYICEQTLTESIHFGKAGAGATGFEYELGDAALALAVEQVGLRESA